MGLSSAQTVITVEANADLSTKQFFFMTVNSVGRIAPTGDGLAADGVLLDKPSAAGRAGALQIGGRAKVSAGATITAGDEVASDAAGEAVPAATGDVVLGRALSGGANGEIIDMIFQPRGAAT